MKLIASRKNHEENHNMPLKNSIIAPMASIPSLAINSHSRTAVTNVSVDVLAVYSKYIIVLCIS